MPFYKYCLLNIIKTYQLNSISLEWNMVYFLFIFFHQIKEFSQEHKKCKVKPIELFVFLNIAEKLLKVALNSIQTNKQNTQGDLKFLKTTI